MVIRILTALATKKNVHYTLMSMYSAEAHANQQQNIVFNIPVTYLVLLLKAQAVHSGFLDSVLLL